MHGHQYHCINSSKKNSEKFTIVIFPLVVHMIECIFFFWWQEYVKGLSSSGMQSNHGFEGQINACWTHKLTRDELDRIRSAGILVSIIHGRLACNFSFSPLTVINQFYWEFLWYFLFPFS